MKVLINSKFGQSENTEKCRQIPIEGKRLLVNTKQLQVQIFQIVEQ
jgi:hypothetical protein